ncbi:hypothetical protein D3C80_951960 [compost metagenome]
MAVICKAREFPLFKLPTFQIPVALLYFPPPLSLTYVYPGGSLSDTVIPVALLGPLLVTLIVNTTLSFILTVVGDTVFCNDKSA